LNCCVKAIFGFGDKLVVLAVVVLVLLGVYVIFGSIRQHRLLINKFVVVLSIMAIAVILIQGSLSSKNPQQAEYYQQIAPTVQQAPFVLPTPSRSYYIATFNDLPESLTLTNYYFYNKKEWEHSDIPLFFDRSITEYKNIKVIKRNIGG